MLFSNCTIWYSPFFILHQLTLHNFMFHYDDDDDDDDDDDINDDDDVNNNWRYPL